MITCTVKIPFSAAKRLLDYEGKCHQLHGYQHMVEATFVGDESKDLTIDFYHLKDFLGKWIDDNLDHTVVLNKVDNVLGDAIANVTGQVVYYMDGDPTAENIALHLKDEVCPQLFPEAQCVKLRLYDSEDAWVEV